MTAWARFRTPDGGAVTLFPGDIVGRFAGAALHLDDARISEAHALISLRDGALQLLGLRGRFAIGGELRSAVTLDAGLRIHLARGLELTVEAVGLPEAAPALVGDDLPRQLLPATGSLTVRPRPALTPRYLGDADAWIWTTGESWRLRVGAGEAAPLEVGAAFEVGGRRFEVVLAPLRSAAATHVSTGFAAPLTLWARYDTAHIRQAGDVVISFNGVAARLLSELVAFAGPVHWSVLAQEVWRGESDRIALRRCLDTNLARLRAKLRAARVRADLIRCDGQGHVELLLLDGDRIEDESGISS